MYLVTGATGNVGKEVVAQLLERGKNVRVFVRDQDKAAHWGDGVQVAIGDFNQPDTFERALFGVKAVFLMNGGLDGRVFEQLIAAAKNPAPRIVFMSTILAGAADSQIGQLHKDKEDVIRASDLYATFIRPGAFMTNALQWIGTIKAEGVVYNAMGGGKTAPIAQQDIAAVAVAALTSPGPSYEVFDLTGDELLNVPDQVSLLAAALGRPIRCVDISVESAVQGFLRAGAPARLAAAVGQSYEAVRNGRAAAITRTIERVTGHPPKRFEVWAREQAFRFA